jgi:hypothetical protein
VTKVPDSKDLIVRQGDHQIYSGNDFSLYLLKASENQTFDLTKLNETPY